MGKDIFGKDILPDIDDTLEQAIGGALGTLIVYLVARWWRKRNDEKLRLGGL